MEKIKVGIVDDQRLFRIGFAKVLKSFSNIDLLIEAESGKDLLEQLEKLGVPDVILLDLDMPEMDGIKVGKILNDRYPDLKLIILTGHDDDELIVRLLQDGFSAYLHKDAHEDEVEQAINQVVKDGSFLSMRAQEAMNSNSSFSGINFQAHHFLTPLELEIIKLICKGYKDVEIADMLNKGLRTIQNQRLTLRKKINANAPADIISYALKHNLVNGAEFYNYKKKFSN